MAHEKVRIREVEAMSPETQSVRNLFVAAVKLPPDHWEAFLKEACAGDEELRRQVMDLLQEHQQAGSFLNQPAAHVRATGDLMPGVGSQKSENLAPAKAPAPSSAPTSSWS